MRIIFVGLLVLVPLAKLSAHEHLIIDDIPNPFMGQKTSQNQNPMQLAQSTPPAIIPDAAVASNEPVHNAINKQNAKTSLVDADLVPQKQVLAPAANPLLEPQQLVPVSESTSPSSEVNAAAQQPDISPEISSPAQATPGPESTSQVSPIAPELAIQNKEESAAQTITQENKPSTPIASDVPQEEQEPKGIDTIDLGEPQGNWLYKRIWWEKAERLYEKIKQLTDHIAQSRMIFFAKRNDLDRTVLDPFYAKIGLSQGELQQAIAYFGEQMQAEHKELGTLTEQERTLQARIEEERKALEQLSLSVQGATNVDHALDDALMKLVDQINLARQYEKKAWEQFKEINRELSDKKARELYYNMDSAWRNLNNINTYISDSFTKYFEQLLEKIYKDTDDIKSITQSLKEKGIDIKEQVQRLRKPTRPRPEKIPEEPQESPGWLGTLWGYITAPFTYLWSGVTGTFDWFGSWFGASTPEVALANPERTEPVPEVKENEPESV